MQQYTDEFEYFKISLVHTPEDLTVLRKYFAPQSSAPEVLMIPKENTSTLNRGLYEFGLMQI